jgi:hypothetical protein
MLGVVMTFIVLMAVAGKDIGLISGYEGGHGLGMFVLKIVNKIINCKRLVISRVTKPVSLCILAMTGF